MSDFQKNSSNFEDLCLKIVKKLLGNSLNKIKKTQPSKDGGYDIDATIKYKNKQYSVLFECKLRGKNVNLRDIAANVIIAYNNCTDSLVFMINQYFTPQLEEQLLRFRDSSQLNIKVLIGSDIENVIQNNNIPVSTELAELLKDNNKSRKNKHISSLVLNTDSENICKQIIENHKLILIIKNQILLHRFIQMSLIEPFHYSKIIKALLFKAILAWAKVLL